MVSPDYLNNGFLEDIELVIQLVMDQGNMKLKMICKKGANVAKEVLDVLKFKESFPDQDEFSDAQPGDVRFISVGAILLLQNLFSNM